ncbi:MAG: hypothetical protein K2X49_15185 [Acetobacteraceae bacterium]|nr:hypothetical protein [Acetobacteraceae bacterium]
MATVLGQFGLGAVDKLVHDTAAALLAKDVPGKLAGTLGSAITAGFGVVSDVLEIVRDVTAPEPAPPPAPPGP